QVLEVGTIRQRHGAPSFLVPGGRGVGRKVVMSTRSAGGFDPSRGPSAAWTAHRESTSARRQVKGRAFASDGSYKRGEGSGVASPIAHAAGGSKRSRCEAATEGRTRGVLSVRRACGRRSQRSRWAFFSRRLAFDAAGAPPLDEVALHGDEEGDGGDGNDHAGRHDHAPVHDGGVEEVVDAHGQRLQLLGGDEHEGEEEVVPGEDEGEDAGGDDAGEGEGQDHVPHGAAEAGAVYEGRLLQL